MGLPAGPGPIVPECRNWTVPELERHYHEAVPLLRPILGCPTVAYGGVQVAEQFFKRGFGQVWRQEPGVREALGWATTSERSDRATLQFFDNGVMIWLTGTDFVY